MRKEFWETLTPTDAQSERLLQHIREKADSPVRTHRRPLRIAAVIAAVLVMTTVASVVAAPAMIRYFVPHLGMVEVPETTDDSVKEPLYLFMKPYISEQTGNHYRMGYIYGNTAYVYIYMPLPEEFGNTLTKLPAGELPPPNTDKYEKQQAFIAEVEALGTENLQVEYERIFLNASLSRTLLSEWRLIFTDLDEAAVENGLSFMGDTICFETPNIEYEVYTQEHNGIRLSLIPLANDYSVFSYTLETDETVPGTAALVYDSRWMTAGYSSPFFVFVDADGHRFKAQMADNIIYLEKQTCSAPLVQLYAGRLDFELAIDPVTFTLEMPAEGETTEKEIILPFGNHLGKPTVKASLSYNTAQKNDGTWQEYMNPRYPNGTLTLRIADMVSADGTAVYRVQYPMFGDAYRKALHQARTDGQQIIVNTFENFRTVPYVENDLNETECYFSRMYLRPGCVWSFTFD